MRNVRWRNLGDFVQHQESGGMLDPDAFHAVGRRLQVRRYFSPAQTEPPTDRTVVLPMVAGKPMEQRYR
jgi:hypothetical protein